MKRNKKRTKEQIHFEDLTLLSQWQNLSSKYKWQCTNGHVFEARIKSLDRNGGRCITCSGFNITIEDCQALAKERGGECLSPEYINNITHLTWKCNKGHVWQASWPTVSVAKAWCPYCAGCARKTIEDCHKLAFSKNGKCLSTEYINNITKMLWECSKGHNFLAGFNSINYDKSWCPRCVNNVSKPESLLLEFVRSVYSDTIGNKSKLLKSKRFRLDIYIPSLKKAIEFDGDYWHSRPGSLLRDFRKNKECQEAGIELLRIKEKDYRKDPESVKRIILGFLSL